MNTDASGSGIGFGGLLFVVFLVLKLTGVIAWSWWWVPAPLWIPVTVAAVLGLVALSMYVMSLLWSR